MIDELLSQIEEDKKILIDVIDKDVPYWVKDTIGKFRTYLSEGKCSEDERDFMENNKQEVIQFCLLFDIYVPLSHLIDYVMAKYDLNKTMELNRLIIAKYGKSCKPEEVFDILQDIPTYDVLPVLMLTDNHLSLEKCFNEKDKVGFLRELGEVTNGLKEILVYCRYVSERKLIRDLNSEIIEKTNGLSQKKITCLKSNIMYPIIRHLNFTAELPGDDVASEEHIKEGLARTFGSFVELSHLMSGWHIEFCTEIIKKGSYLAPYFMPIYFEVIERITEGGISNWFENIKAQYGEDSNEYKTQVMLIQKHSPQLYARIDLKHSSKKSNRGRKSGNWLAINCEMTEDEIRKRFESDIYPSLDKDLESLKLKKKLKDGDKDLTGKDRENALIYLRACFVYYTTELLHVAHPISSTSNQEDKRDFINSLARTLSVNKTTFQKYYKVFDKYEKFMCILSVKDRPQEENALEFGEGWHLVHNNNIKPNMKLLTNFLNRVYDEEKSDTRYEYQILQLNIEKFNDIIAKLEKAIAPIFGIKLKK